MDIGRGGACVPARVAPQGRPSLNSPRKMHVFLIWKRRYADVRAGTQAPPLRFRLARLRVGRLSLFGWIARGRLVSLGWIACKWLFGLCGIAWKNMMEMGRGGAYVPARVALQGRIHR